MVNAPVEVKVEGLQKTVRALENLGVSVEDLKDAFAALAQEGATKAKGYAPVRTGTLAASIRGNRAKNKAVVTAGRARVPYAGAINYGWPSHGIKPNPFMQRASDDVGKDAIQQLETAIIAAARKQGLV